MVLIPISAPNPNRKPSAKRVEALQITLEELVEEVERLKLIVDSLKAKQDQAESILQSKIG